MTPSYPSPIRTDGSNDFARQSMAKRVPRIFQEAIDRNPDYPRGIHQNIRRLKDAIAHDKPLKLFDPPAPDYDWWHRRFSDHQGESWLGTEWLFAEMLAYRHLADACRYWTTRRDPFHPVKKEEMESEAVISLLNEALHREGGRAEQLRHALVDALWGNRMDLSMKGVLAQGVQASDDQLLVDDTPAVVDDLLAGEPGTVHIIMDNAGTEEAFDLALVDRLLRDKVARSVTLHVKMIPVLVSDVLGEDVYALLDVLEASGGPVAQLAERIHGYINRGSLHIIPDLFWSTDGRMHELPPRLQQGMENASLIVAKGDANYRRATNDAIWPQDARWEEAVASLPAPFLALRTIKSDTLVGVAPDTTHRLDEQEGAWRTEGSHAVAQYAL